MTDALPLTDVIVDAIDNSGVQSHYLYVRGDGLITLDGRFDLDRITTAIRDHFLNRDKVRAALFDACDDDGIICDDPLIIERTIDDDFIGRLIAGLSR